MVSVRTFQDSDYEELIQLWRRANLGLTLSDISAEIRQFAEFNPNSFFILELDSTIIGSVIATFDGRRGYVYHLAVDPEFQGRGFGGLLMAQTDSYYKTLNVVKVHLMVDSPNDNVIPFYEKLGWVIRDDIILMSKTLRDASIEIAKI